MGDSIIRTYTGSDRDAVLSLARRLTEDVAAWRDETAVRKAVHSSIAELLAKIGADRVVFVADSGGTILGVVTVSRRQHFTGVVEASVDDLFVAQDAEGRGTGAALLDRAEQWARDHDLPMLTVETRADNDRARRLYERAGFQPEDIRFTKPLQ